MFRLNLAVSNLHTSYTIIFKRQQLSQTKNPVGFLGPTGFKLKHVSVGYPSTKLGCGAALESAGPTTDNCTNEFIVRIYIIKF
jgi:hypothetical protein